MYLLWLGKAKQKKKLETGRHQNWTHRKIIESLTHTPPAHHYCCQPSPSASEDAAMAWLSRGQTFQSHPSIVNSLLFDVPPNPPTQRVSEIPVQHWCRVSVDQSH